MRFVTGPFSALSAWRPAAGRPVGSASRKTGRSWKRSVGADLALSASSDTNSSSVARTRLRVSGPNSGICDGYRPSAAAGGPARRRAERRTARVRMWGHHSRGHVKLARPEALRQEHGALGACARHGPRHFCTDEGVSKWIVSPRETVPRRRFGRGPARGPRVLVIAGPRRGDRGGPPPVARHGLDPGPRVGWRSLRWRPPAQRSRPTLTVSRSGKGVTRCQATSGRQPQSSENPFGTWRIDRSTVSMLVRPDSAIVYSSSRWRMRRASETPFFPIAPNP